TMARRNGSATGVFSYRTLARSSLSFGLKALVSVASKCVACMQPDSIRPAAKTPSITFSDDMIWFQSATTNLRGAWAKPKDHDSVDPIIVEICHNSSLSDLFPRCETSPVAFLPQFLRSWA